MKKLLTLFAMLTLFVSMMAQTTPLNYQAVLRNPVNNELLRNQAGAYQMFVIQNNGPIEFEGGEFQTNSDGMVNIPLIASNEMDWMSVDTIMAVFIYGDGDDSTITIVTPVAPVPYAFHTDYSYLTTDHIVDYIHSDIDGTDIDAIYQTLKLNPQLHDGMRDSIVKYIKENYDKAKEIGYHYLFLITATDLNQFYHEGQTIDQEVKDSIYSMAKKFLKDNRAMLVELAKYYAETASAAEVNQLYNELLSNSTASVKIRELLYSYFDAYLVRKGLDGCNLCDIFNSFDPNVTPPTPTASVELLGHGINTSRLYGYLRVYNTTLDQGDVKLRADGTNHEFTPTLETANLANGSANTIHDYRFTIPYSELAQYIDHQYLAHGLTLLCTLNIKHGNDLDEEIESPFDIDIECPSPVVTNGKFELTVGDVNYSGQFLYENGSDNVTVTGKWSDSNGEHQFNMTDNSPALTIDKTTKKVSVVIPNDSVMLEVASQLYVTITLKDINCEDTTVWASYVSEQFLCPFAPEEYSVDKNPNNPFIITIEAQFQNYDPDMVSVENSGVKINDANGTFVATIVAGNNTFTAPYPHIEISNDGLMTANIDCSTYGINTFYVIPFIASNCSDGVISDTYSDVEASPEMVSFCPVLGSTTVTPGTTATSFTISTSGTNLPTTYGNDDNYGYDIVGSVTFNSDYGTITVPASGTVDKNTTGVNWVLSSNELKVNFDLAQLVPADFQDQVHNAQPYYLTLTPFVLIQGSTCGVDGRVTGNATIYPACPSVSSNDIDLNYDGTNYTATIEYTGGSDFLQVEGTYGSNNMTMPMEWIVRNGNTINLTIPANQAEVIGQATNMHVTITISDRICTPIELTGEHYIGGGN